MKPTKAPKGASSPAESLFDSYEPLAGAYDELFDASGNPRPGVGSVAGLLDALGRGGFKSRKQLADRALLRGGVTFTVYGNKGGTEKVFPFDLIPRVVSAADWKTMHAGLAQRIQALNAFLADIYGEQRILREGHIPAEVVKSSSGFLPEVMGVRPPGGVYVNVAGIDLIRDAQGAFVVLEDNLRCPSGVSYVLENRSVLKRVLPGVFASAGLRSVDDYPTRLLERLLQCAPTRDKPPHLVVLSPGPYNSAYFEHSFLARSMGCDLVVPSDLFVDEDRVFVKTTAGPVQVDVIYRRIDDEFIDPQVFRADSLLGVPGLVSAYRAGNVTLANALGNGVADDKGVYPFVPDMIRFYLDQEPIVGQVHTLSCARPKDRAEVLAHPERFVIKSVDASGGYGMVMGPMADAAELAEIKTKIEANGRGYIAQPLIELSTCPTWCRGKVAPRRVDLRPYVLTGNDVWVLPGGLTRVALKEGSYVVNSSQGGGSKDTWVMEDDR